jgi:hypothetical protein
VGDGGSARAEQGRPGQHTREHRAGGALGHLLAKGCSERPSGAPAGMASMRLPPLKLHRIVEPRLKKWRSLSRWAMTTYQRAAHKIVLFSLVLSRLWQHQRRNAGQGVQVYDEVAEASALDRS